MGLKRQRKLSYGVGVNDADYAVQLRRKFLDENGKLVSRIVWECPFWASWISMLERCYSEALQKKFPTYKDCYVCDEWLLFSNFRLWMEQHEWQNRSLDKDLLVYGNKVYSPDTCMFIPQQINLLIQEKKRGTLTGLAINRPKTRFQATVQDQTSNKSLTLGTYDTLFEAKNVWIAKKIEIAIKLHCTHNSDHITKSVISHYLQVRDEFYKEFGDYMHCSAADLFDLLYTFSK